MALRKSWKALCTYGFLAFLLWIFTIFSIFKHIPSEKKENKIVLHTLETAQEKRRKIVQDFVYPPEKSYNACPDRIKDRLKHKANTYTVCKTSENTCKSVNCLDIISGNASAKHLVSESSHAFRNLIWKDPDVINISRRCDNLFEAGGYSDNMLTAAEANFPIAYSILVYKDAGQVERLLRTIYQPNNAYCIHVDRESPDTFRNAIKSIVKCFPNVILSSRSVRVVYAGFSRLFADILCMKELMQSPHQWKYLINLAGSAMPIKTNWEIVQILSVYNGSNNVEGLAPNSTLQERFRYKWIVSNSTKKHKMMKTNITKTPPPHDLTIIRGSAYGAFTRGFVNYILSDKIANDLLQWSMDTYSPDEHYWATLNYLYYNPHLKTPGGFKGPAKTNDWFASYSLWPTEELCMGTVKSLTSPCVFGVYSIPDLVSRRELFANKFSADFEPLAQVCLGSLIQLRSKCQIPFHIKYFKELPVVRNKNLVQL